MVPQDDMCVTDVGHGGEPPTKTVDELWGYPLGLRVNNIAPNEDGIGLEDFKLLEQVFERLSILFMTCQPSPVHVRYMCASKLQETLS